MLTLKLLSVMSICLEIMTIVNVGQILITKSLQIGESNLPFFMPKNQLTKDEIKVRVLKLKERLYRDQPGWDSKGLAHKYLNEVLDIIDEYRY